MTKQKAASIEAERDYWNSICNDPPGMSIACFATYHGERCTLESCTCGCHRWNQS